MKLENLPVAHPKPNIALFLSSIKGDSTPERPPLVEYIVDDLVIRPIVTGLLGRNWVATPDPGYWDNFIQFWYRLGYDILRMELSLPFPRKTRDAIDPGCPAAGRIRSWAETDRGPIQSWEQFDKYPWPIVMDASFELYEYVDSHLPDGMGVLACHAGGVFEHVSQLMGYHTLALTLYDDPELVEALTNRIGSLILQYHKRLLEFEHLVAIFQGDDMGFRTGTLISPEHLRKYFLPWHKKFAEQAHRHGRSYFLHSCGNIESIMPDLINEVAIDAKHSFEDAVMPVAEAKRRYGDRIGILGGVDVNVLARQSPDGVRRYVRNIISACATGGRFAIGSGNSIPSYVPVENYLAMLDEALR